MNEIEIPPLRKRREDLKQMIDDIIDRYQGRTRKMTITPDVNSSSAWVPGLAWGTSPRVQKSNGEGIY